MNELYKELVNLGRPNFVKIFGYAIHESADHGNKSIGFASVMELMTVSLDEVAVIPTLILYIYTTSNIGTSGPWPVARTTITF